LDKNPKEKNLVRIAANTKPTIKSTQRVLRQSPR